MSNAYPKMRAGRLARTATAFLAVSAMASGVILATATAASADAPIAACAQIDPTHLSVSVDTDTGLLGSLANVATVTLTDTNTGAILGVYPQISLLDGLIDLQLPNVPVPAGVTDVTTKIQPIGLLGNLLTPIIGSTPCAALPIQALTGSYEVVTPARILDTRSTTKIPAKGSIVVPVAGHGGIPTTFGLLDDLSVPIPGTAPSAVSINLTATNATAPGYLAIYPTGTTRPGISNLNFAPGKAIANTAISKLGTDGSVTIYNDSTAPVDVVGDVYGYYNTGVLTSLLPLTPGAYVPLTPSRLLDTRTTGGKLLPTSTRTVSVTSGLGTAILAGVGAVVMNVTVTNPTEKGHLRLFPTGTALPFASNVNFDAGKTVANVVVVKPDATGHVSIYNGSLDGSTDVVVDVLGYIASGVLPAQTPGLQAAVTPFRLLDTRTTIGGPKAMVPAGGTRVVQVAGIDGVPSKNARAAVITVTATDEATVGFATVYPGPARPKASILNFVKNTDVANMMIAPINADGTITIYNGSLAPTDLVIDISAYVTGATASLG